ncbi:Protein kinase domain [Arabidopsis suecica]|uniref:Receptor-like serine/threonine-protein kinase n=1 Tax=Arabidopsis suecica TaxID=45249 RepID=A0A8T2BNS4_ARASU|nr:Protein kinase domain [Arabidopsis suecica]
MAFAYMFFFLTLNLKEIVVGDTRVRMGMTRFACFLLFTLLLSFSYAAITPTSPLSIGQTLSSSNGVYELGFFSPNNTKEQYVGIWLKGTNPQVVVWVANREKPATDSTANLTISSNGTLLLLDGNNGVVWSIKETFFFNGSQAELLDNGNFIVRNNVLGRTLWQSFEHLGDTMLPFSTLIYNHTTGEKRMLTSWKSYNDPSPGEFTVQITSQVPSQVCTMRGSKPYWRSGPWAKTRFTGIPQMDDTYTSPISLQQDANGSATLTYSDRNVKPPRMMITSEGSLKIFQHSGTDWELNFEAPTNLCEIYGACGPFGLCVTSVPPKCKCFKGFVPKSIEEWKRGNWTDGCVRRTELRCQGNSTANDANVFYHVANIKPPDFYEYVKADAEECYQSCLHNCSCLAFSYINGIGCLMWNKDLMDVVQFSAGGELLSIRLASSELGGNERSKTIAASIASLSLFVILASAAFGFWRYRVKHNANISQDTWSIDLKPQDIPGLDFFDMNTIQNATNNFSLSNKLGQGGFGSVYKGKLQDGKEIAVKRLSSSSGQGKEEFMNEIVLISKLQHRNLVRVLGYCIEGEEKLLIYEFMVNKSLDTFLFDSRKRLEIDWPKRFHIIQGVARGLLYLHRDSRLRVIHRDLKVSNILLDEKMNPKISDFGLARMYQGTEYQDNTRRVVGTLGYMSPEYAWTGMFSEKSDIYSFGVLLLEIISGEKISRFSNGIDGKTLLAYAWESWSENGGIDLLEKDVADSCHPLEVGRCVQIGLLCVQHNPADRPNTLELLSMLTTTSDLASPEQPTFALHARDDEPQFRDLSTVNKMTQSLILAR